MPLSAIREETSTKLIKGFMLLIMENIVLLTAPTASGKTSLALELAQQFVPLEKRLEVISADAFTIYRGLDIGTAKPSLAEQKQLKHHLIDVIPVQDGFDVTQFVQLAEQTINDVIARGNIPLVLGGTGFYVSALLRGLPLTPPSDPEKRQMLEQELAERGLDALLAEIAHVNPQEAKRMERNPRRVIRSLEVFRATNKWPSEFGYAQPRFTYHALGFTWPQAILEQRIHQRTRQMLQNGWPSEALWLAEQVDPEQKPRPTVWQALGYTHALALARGDLDLSAATEAICLATRQYTKRQMTWMKKQELEWLDPEMAKQRLMQLLEIE